MTDKRSKRAAASAEEYADAVHDELTPAEAATPPAEAQPPVTAASAHAAQEPDVEEVAEAAAGGEVAAQIEPAETDDLEYVEENVVVMRRGAFLLLTAAAALLIVALAAANVYQALKPSSAVARVNGSAITRKDYDKAIASANGPQVLDNLIEERLIAQDAARKRVSVSGDEVDARLRQVKGEFKSEDEYRQALVSNHVTELNLRDSIRQSMLLQKLTADRVQVSDADVQKTYDDGKDTRFKGKSFDEVKDQIRNQLSQDKQQEAAGAYLDDLKKNAKISKHLPGA